MQNFAAYILRTEHILLMVAVWSIISTVQRLVPGIRDNRYWARLLPVLPMMACSVAIWLPGLSAGAPSEKVLLGIVLGAFCGQAHKIARQTVFGNDKRIQGGFSRL